MSTPEKREFAIHQSAIHHLIKSQSGSFSKAMCELISNSVDAGATRCDITFNLQNIQQLHRGDDADSPGKFVISDDGKGFTSREEVVEFFETFSTPHEDTPTFGRFRIGRGQIFSFAKTTWTSGRFRMEVDIQQNGLNYHLTESKQELYAGCKIEGDLYPTDDPYHLRHEIHSLKSIAVNWIKIPVTVDGQQVNDLPGEHEWDHEDDDAYYQFRDFGGLDIYNQGVYVRAYPAEVFGLAGQIVSKRPLTLNMSRNEILTNQCPVFENIRAYLAIKSRMNINSKSRLTDAERMNVINGLQDKSLALHEALNAPILMDVRKRYFTLNNFLNRVQVVTAEPPQGSVLAESLANTKPVQIISSRTMSELDCDDVEELQDTLGEIINYGYHVIWTIAGEEGYVSERGYLEVDEADPAIRDFFKTMIPQISRLRERFDSTHFVELKDLTDSMDESYVTLEDKKLSWKQRIALKTLRRANKSIHKKMKQHGLVKGKARKVYLGLSDNAHGWTDGFSEIVIHRDTAKLADKGMPGLFKVLSVMVHEYLHDTSDTDGHRHTYDFYESFHDFISGPTNLDFTNIVKSAAKNQRQLYLEAGREPPKLLFDGADDIKKFDQNTIHIVTKDDAPLNKDIVKDVKQYGRLARLHGGTGYALYTQPRAYVRVWDVFDKITQAFWYPTDDNIDHIASNLYSYSRISYCAHNESLGEILAEYQQHGSSRGITGSLAAHISENNQHHIDEFLEYLDQFFSTRKVPEATRKAILAPNYRYRKCSLSEYLAILATLPGSNIECIADQQSLRYHDGKTQRLDDKTGQQLNKILSWYRRGDLDYCWPAGHVYEHARQTGSSTTTFDSFMKDTMLYDSDMKTADTMLNSLLETYVNEGRLTEKQAARLRAEVKNYHPQAKGRTG